MSSKLCLDNNDVFQIFSELAPVAKKKRSFFHVVNPLTPKSTSDLSYAQPVTLRSMQQSASFAQIADNNIDVIQLAAAFAEDIASIPDSFVTLPYLDRDVTDLSDFDLPRPLPILWDILERTAEYIKSAETPGSNYIIYTNIDIGTMPQFYMLVDKIAESGIDAFCINRRTVSNQLRDLDSIPLLSSDYGEKHPGFDCIVFDARLFDEFCPFQTCLGAIHVMRPLLNLMALAEKFHIFTELHATYHIGNDAVWCDSRFHDYEKYNMKSVIEVFDHAMKSSRGKEKLLEYSKEIDWIWLRKKRIKKIFNIKNN